MWLYQIRISIYEPGKAYPVVVHLFQGETVDEAEGYHAAHRAADKFLREAEDVGLYNGRVSGAAIASCARRCLV